MSDNGEPAPDERPAHRPPSSAVVVPAAPVDVVELRDPLRAMAMPPAPPEAPGGGGGATDGITPGELLRILRRRWLVALPVLLAAVGASVARYVQVTPQYEAGTSIRLDKKQQELMGITSPGMVEQRRSLGTETQILKSRAVSRAVAARTAYAVRVARPRAIRSTLMDSVTVASSAPRGSYRFQGVAGRVQGTAPDGQTAIGDAGMWMELAGLRLIPTARMTALPEVVLTVDGLDAAVDRLQRTLKVTQPARDADVLRITVRDPDPRLAAQLSDGVAEVFSLSQTNRRQAGGRNTVEFIRAQLDTLDGQLLAAELKLRDWRASQQVVVPTAEAGAAVERRTSYETRIAEKQIALEELEGMLAAASKPRATPAEQIRDGFRSVLSSPMMKEGGTGGNIVTTLLQLESQRADLLRRRTPNDPEVQVLNKTISDYESQGQLVVRTYLEGLRTEIDGYQRGLKKLGTTLQAFPGQELTLATLQRNAQVLSTLQGTLRTRLKEAEIANAADVSTSEVLDRADVPSQPAAPILYVYAGVGLGAGLVLALFAALLVDRTDRTIHSREDLEAATQAPLVGLIPSFVPVKQPKLPATASKPKRERKGTVLEEWAAAGSTSEAASRGSVVAATTGRAPVIAAPSIEQVISIVAPRHVASEAYRMLRTNLRFAPADRPNHVLSVSSPSPGDGKSTTVINLAATIALQGKRVLVVDGDMRRGTLHQKLGLDRRPGLSALLSTHVEYDTVIRPVQLAEGVVIDVLTCGDVPPNPTELLGGTMLPALVAWARERYDQVLLDTPPVNMFADGMLLAAASDSLLLVGRAGKSFRDELAVAAEQLRSLQVRLAGVVLNDFDPRRDGRFGGYYYYERYQYKYYAAYAEEPVRTAS